MKRSILQEPTIHVKTLNVAVRIRQVDTATRYGIDTGGMFPLDYPHLTLNTEQMSAALAVQRIQDITGLA